MRCNWRRWLWGIIPLLMLGWVAVQAEHDPIEADLRQRAALALSQVGMGWAATRVTGRDVVLSGRAGDDAEPQRAADALRGVWGVRVVDNLAEVLPKVETYTWSAGRRGNRIRIVGHVPNRATRHVILGVAKANFPGFEVIDRMATMRGVPSTDAWLGGVSFALKQLAALKRGDVRLEGLGMWIAGEAEDAAGYRAVKSALANGLPKGIKLTDDLVTAPVVSPFTWSAQFADGRLVLGGHVTSEAARAELVAAAKAGFAAAVLVDRMQPGEGAPQGWRTAAAASIKELARLESGSAELKDAALTLTGVADDKETAEAVRRALRAVLPATIKLADHVKAKEPPPPPPSPTLTAPAPSPSPPAKEQEPVTARAAEPSAPPPPGAAPAPPKDPATASRPAATPPSPPADGPALAKAKDCEDTLTGLAKAGRIQFRLASADLDEASFETLDKLAVAAKACPGTLIEVGGHASAEGSAELNQELSLKRARSVVAYLVEAGVEATRLEPVGYGATQPAAPNDSGENMARNRRIGFAVRPK